MNHDHHSDHNESEIAKETLAYCPVMEGMAVDKQEAEKEGRVREYKGKKYYLCCDSCVEMFDQNPEEFAK